MEKKKMRKGVKVCFIISIVLIFLALILGLSSAGIIYNSCIGVDIESDPMAETGQFFGVLMIIIVLVHIGAYMLGGLAAVWGTYGMVTLLRWLWKNCLPGFWIVLVLYIIVTALISILLTENVINIINMNDITSVLYPSALR